jgi:hypothetical protein
LPPPANALPKLPIFALLSAVNNTLLGLRSRCRILFACKYPTPFTSEIIVQFFDVGFKHFF